MSLRTCRHCGHQVHQTAVSCPNCGGPTPGLGSSERARGGVLLAVWLAVLIVPLALLFYSCMSAVAL